MGGTSTSSSTQQSQTSPWSAAQPMLSSILSSLAPQISNSGINGTQTAALNSVEANAANGNPYAPAIGATTTSLLNGGGAMNQAGAVNQDYQNYYNQTNPLASNTNYDPMQTPGIGTALQGLSNTISTGINGSFAAAGRDGSPANSQSTAYGLAQGLAPILTGQYNQNVQNQQGAASNLYNAGNTTSGLLSGMQNQANTNAQAGAALAPTALDANNYSAEQNLAAEAQRTGIPAQNLSLLAQIGIPIASLGSQSSGSTQGSQTMSGAQQFQTIMSGIGSLIPKSPMSFNFG